MLRHMGQHGGGVLVYTRNLLPRLLDLGSEHEFVLLYQHRAQLGAYGGHDHVREVALPVPSRLLWDQVAVPVLARRERLDILFNPKYSLPLAVRCPTVFVCHGMDWYVTPQWSRWTDRLNHRVLIPRYARKATKVIAVSETAREHFIHFLRVAPERVETVYLGVNEDFYVDPDARRRQEVRERYDLPERFFLYVGQIYPPKNFGRLLRAYARVGPELGIPLVVAGELRWLSGDELALVGELGLESWVVHPGWIEHDELPVYYRLATALLMPSLYEACPSPPLEAMASDCPVLTADRHGTAEIAGGAALLLNPESVEEIAAGIERIATDQDLRKRLISEGRRRVRDFSWETCARETLRVLEGAA